MHSSSTKSVRVLRTTQLAKQTWILPFSAGGYWVSDARGTSVCECTNMALAVELAKLLNQQASSAHA